MKKFGVKELADMSGLSIRTIHFYDSKGLLKPESRSKGAYRLYGEKELLRLQQILFYRELDFPLKEIKEMLDNPDFDPVSALNKHKQALKERRTRISRLLSTIDHTITELKKGNIMTNPEMLYEGLPKETGKKQREEAMKKYGKQAVEHSEKELMKLGKAGFNKLKHELEQLLSDLFELSHLSPESVEVQALIQYHYKIIRKFWGTSERKDPQAEAYAGLGQLYLQDERYTMVAGKSQAGFASFLQKAMQHFADHDLK